jgi:hypothetical protein
VLGTGDLVEFTHPHARDVGIVIRTIEKDDYRRQCVHVLWSSEPFIESLAADSEHLKLLNKAK